MPALSHPDLDIQATRPPPPLSTHLPPFPLTTVSAYDLPVGQAHKSSNSHRAWFATQPQCVAMVKPPHCAAVCWTRPGVLSVKSKALPPALWQSPLPLEPLIITCEGGLVIFLIILHFISIPPFKTQHENWLPQRSIFIISPRPINYPTLGQGGRAVQAQADPCHSRAEPHHCSVLGEQSWMGLLFCSLKTGGKKKYTCYLVNPQTCKIGISWMSATEMELTRDLFIVTEGH